MILFEAALIAVLVGCFAGAVTLAVAEVTIIRVRRSEVLVEARSGSARSAQLLRLLDDLPVVLNTVLLLVLLLHVSAATIGGFLADRWFGGIGVTAVTVLLTIVLFVYAEAIPKTRAVQAPHRMALRLTPLLLVLVRVLRPIVSALVWLAERHTGGSAIASQAVTEPELRALARESAEVGAIGRGDAELVDRSFEFNDRMVAEVMIPRSGIVAAAGNEPVADALDRAITFGHRRLPVFGTGPDDIVGVVRLRDLAAAAPEVTVAEGSLVSDALRCGPDDLVPDLLRRMQRRGQWMAVVGDGTGRTVGLVTVEDLVAELVGEIEDERSVPNHEADGGHRRISRRDRRPR